MYTKRRLLFLMCCLFAIAQGTWAQTEYINDFYLYCAQHTLGSHARVVNAAHFGNLYHTGPAEFLKK